MRILLPVLLIGAVVVSIAAAQKPRAYSCIVTVDPAVSQAPDYNGLIVSGTAPRKASVYLRVTTATVVESEWTALHNVRGVVGPDPTVRVLYPGNYTAQLIDLSTSDLGAGYVNVVAECPFTVE